MKDDKKLCPVKLNLILFGLDANTSGNERTAGIQVVDGINDPTLVIIQDA